MQRRAVFLTASWTRGGAAAVKDLIRSFGDMELRMSM
jgi:hypothetical protein